MEERKSFFIPILIIICGVLLQLKALGLLGPADDGFLAKVWPILLIAAALDLIITQHRLISGIIILFTALALLSTQLLDSGWNSSVWNFFLNFWPLLVVFYGVDSIFAGRSLISSVLIVVLLIVAVYALMATFDYPILKNLRLPAGNGQIPDQTAPSMMGNAGNHGKNNPSSGRSINYPLPSQSSAFVKIESASGKVQMKAANLGNSILAGNLTLDESEDLIEEQDLSAQTATYYLCSRGKGNPVNLSNWNLDLSTQRPTQLSVMAENGYILIDMRGMDLVHADIENKTGPIDVMTPVLSQAPIRLNAGNGDIRVYIPVGGFVACKISGTDSVVYPPQYTLSAGQVFPISYTQEPVMIEIMSNGRNVQIIQNQG